MPKGARDQLDHFGRTGRMPAPTVADAPGPEGLARLKAGAALNQMAPDMPRDLLEERLEKEAEMKEGRLGAFRNRAAAPALKAPPAAAAQRLFMKKEVEQLRDADKEFAGRP